MLEFAIGKYFDDVSEYEQAFAHFHRGERGGQALPATARQSGLTETVNAIIRGNVGTG